MKRKSQPITKACTNGIFNLFLALILAGFFLGACSSSSSDPKDTDTTEPDTTDPDTIDPGLCVVGPDQCLTESDCTGKDAICGAPGTNMGCGMPFGGPDTCNDDADCKGDGDHFICKPHECAAGDPSGDGRECVAGCQDDAECGVWQACESGRCNAKSCAADADCPTNFSCTDSVCTRLDCEDGAECQGCCVYGKCYSQPGSCMFMPV